jgi:DNA-binding MarR family transcriptional regulator
MNKTALEQQIINLFRTHQRNIGFVGTVYRSKITLEQIYVLIEVSIFNSISIGELSARLFLPRNTISRSIAALEKINFIKSSPNIADQRRRSFIILKKGDEFLKNYELKARDFVEKHLVLLTSSEIQELRVFQHKICDALKCPDVTIRNTEHPFQEGIRRVTRAFRFVGKSVFESGYSSTDWHILASIGNDFKDCTLSSLSEYLDLLPTTLTQILTRLEKNKLIIRKNNDQDRRTKFLVLSKKGEKALYAIENCGKNLIAKAFPKENDPELQRFVYILGKHLNIIKPEENIVIRNTIEVIQIYEEKDLLEARSFVVYNLVALGKHQHLSSVLLDSKNLILALKEGQQILGTLRIQLKLTYLPIAKNQLNQSC